MVEKEIHLRDYFRIVKKRKATILTFFILTLVVVVIATFTATPMYRASTKVLIEKDTSSSLTSSYRYSPYDPEFLETQYQLIKSAAVVKKVVKSLNPESFYGLIFKTEEKPSYTAMFKTWVKEKISSLKEMAGLEKIFDQPGQGAPVEGRVPLTKAQQLEQVIQAGISAEPVANSRVVEIGFMSANPAVATKVINSVAQAYIDELVEMQMEVSGYSIGWMKKKAEIQRENLEESERNLNDYKRKHDIITVEDRLTVLPERLSDLSKNLTQAETRRKELSAVYSQIRNISREKLETIPLIVENTSVESINKAILAAEQKISELSKKYGPKHPRMITARNEFSSLEKKKSKELEKAVQTIKNEYQLAVSNERDLKELLDQTKFQASQLGEKSIQLEILKRKVETNRFLYDALVKKMKEKGITEQSQPVNVWVIEEAEIPEFPATPRKKRNILLGLILGLFGGIGLAFFLEYLDNTIKTPEDVEENFDLPVIATIDLFEHKKQSLVENILNDSSSMAAENFKGLRTSILLSSADKPPKIILVTSMTPSEGKSSVCSCLGATIAQAGKKVLIIDADMRRPTQHKNFGLENSTGLSSLLAGIDGEDEKIAVPYKETQLNIIPSGPIPPNPSELLSSSRVKTLLDKACARYDMVIIDTPPVASVTDPVLLSQYVDGVIIVTWAGQTTHEILGKGLKQLTDISAPITGLVLNRFSAKKSGYYYNYGDYYYSSEG
ncbi:GumC family protein [Desulfospira joergensenii]|uniref:GumC family protein n=1 Tax=Desulfospira joergensenii TaxID=53329 RepID=UPI00040013E9|nr:polysaccharide biosynthesis tyrosine autokinase [Desulfospira joergensenii]